MNVIARPWRPKYYLDRGLEWHQHLAIRLGIASKLHAWKVAVLEFVTKHACLITPISGKTWSNCTPFGTQEVLWHVIPMRRRSRNSVWNCLQTAWRKLGRFDTADKRFESLELGAGLIQNFHTHTFLYYTYIYYILYVHIFIYLCICKTNKTNIGYSTHSKMHSIEKTQRFIDAAIGATHGGGCLLADLRLPPTTTPEPAWFCK